MQIAKVIDLFQKQDTISLLLKMATRHLLIAGCTGSGKTITARKLAEQFSLAGVPVLITDVKGDVCSISKPANLENPKLQERLVRMEINDFETVEFPTTVWDIFGETGKHLQTNIEEVGHVFLARMLELNPVPAAVLNVLFMVSKEEQFDMTLGTLEQLQFMAKYAGSVASSLRLKYGNVSGATIGVIQRSIQLLKQEGGDRFFGGYFRLADMLRKENGMGVVNVLSAERLFQSPRLYAAVLLWLLTTIYKKLPEVGEVNKPKFAVIVDEAHLLFKHAPDSLLEKIEQVVRLIRSKGVSITFITQNPLDIPDAILGQLGNRIFHALRPSTPKDARSIKAIAQTFRKNPLLDVASSITELGTGEALISMLDEGGVPQMVKKGLIFPPQSRIEPLTKAEKLNLRSEINEQTK